MLGGAGGPMMLRWKWKSWGLWLRFGPHTGDANFTRMKAPLDLSIRRIQGAFHTYRRLFWEVPVARRLFLDK
jgi:hypothetical protein